MRIYITKKNYKKEFKEYFISFRKGFSILGGYNGNDDYEKIYFNAYHRGAITNHTLHNNFFKIIDCHFKKIEIFNLKTLKKELIIQIKISKWIN